MNQAQLEAHIVDLEYGLEATLGLLAAALGSKFAAVESTYSQWRKRLPLGNLSDEHRAMFMEKLGVTEMQLAELEGKFKLANPKYNETDPRYNRTEAVKVVTGCLLQATSGSKREAKAAFQPKRVTRRRNDKP
ncbi:hypothetical protein SEMRO_4018_G352540.1 [Seminavis robusta]|uniref:Uncharacterized protein n=1 Tax=Seminavis robusta TaxID=568900 RepID=A0A9N8I0J4_9STRA|nr:hypothetical protein SEMRO_4018_G352540.1 [Seminavis robusta]|eukprot:Sro4018_g352540.1 n/a (133) ;mRNA; r:1179-1741